jgi:uncharacterized membrane protein YhaH (DUF805 family)
LDLPFDWKSLFSGQGRVGRQTFWTVQMMLVLVDACARATVLLFDARPLILLLVPVAITILVVGVLNMTKRLHDFGRSGWWILLPLAIEALVTSLAVLKMGRGSQGAIASEGVGILAGLAFFLAVGAIKGNPGPNRFGDPPAVVASAPAA